MKVEIIIKCDCGYCGTVDKFEGRVLNGGETELTCPECFEVGWFDFNEED